MDVFSGRCVIAELFLEGAPSSTPSQLFKYREGELSGDGTLGAIADEGVEASIYSSPRIPGHELILP